MAEEVVSTGIERLDEALMRGVPKGFTILVEGTAGSGMELFAKQFANAGVGYEKVVYFTTHESTEELFGIMKRFNWKTDMKVINIATEYYEKVLAKELESARLKQEGLSVSEITRLTGYGAERETINFLTAVVYEMSKLKPPFRIILDSIDFFFEHYPHEEVLSAIRKIRAHTQYNKGVSLITLMKGAWDRELESSVEATVDMIVELETVRLASEFENRMLLKKVKNHPEKVNILVYAVTELGITPEIVIRVA